MLVTCLSDCLSCALLLIIWVARFLPQGAQCVDAICPGCIVAFVVSTACFLNVLIYRPTVSIARAFTSGAHAVAELTHNLHVLDMLLPVKVQHLLPQCSVVSVQLPRVWAESRQTYRSWVETRCPSLLRLPYHQLNSGRQRQCKLCLSDRHISYSIQQVMGPHTRLLDKMHSWQGS